MDRPYLENENYVEYLRSLSKDDLETEIDIKVANTLEEIADSEEFNSAIAETNATFFIIDAYTVECIHIGQNECTVKITFDASGEQLDDKMYCGDVINGKADLVFDTEGKITYQNIIAEVEDCCDNEPEFEDYDDPDA